MAGRNSKSGTKLPPIVIFTDEARRLSALANSNMALFPREAFFLASEMNRANVVPDNSDFRGVVHMGSQVRYCDHRAGAVGDVAMGSHPIGSGKKSPSPSEIQQCLPISTLQACA